MIGLLLRSRAFAPEALRRLMDHPSVGSCVIVLNPTYDGDAYLEIGDLSERVGGNLVVLRQDRRGWSRALNSGFEHFAALDHPPELVLCVSSDAVPSHACVDAMEDAFEGGEHSCAFPSYARSEISYRVPRNTCCVWPAGLVRELGLFDESLDQGQGMEDYDLALRALDAKGRLPCRVPETVDLTARSGPDFDADTRREIEQMRTIESRYPTDVVSRLRDVLDQAPRL